MLVKSDAKQEKEIINQLIENDPELMRQHELFKAEMAFKQELIEARKKNSLTQKDISKMSGLSQQAVSRMEKGTGGTIETIIRYLSSMGYSLSIKRSKRDRLYNILGRTFSGKSSTFTSFPLLSFTKSPSYIILPLL